DRPRQRPRVALRAHVQRVREGGRPRGARPAHCDRGVYRPVDRAPFALRGSTERRSAEPGQVPADGESELAKCGRSLAGRPHVLLCQGAETSSPCFLPRSAERNVDALASESGMISNILTRIFGSRNERLLKQYAEVVRKVNALEPAISALSDDELRGKTEELKVRVANGESLDDVMPDAFAVVREAGKRTLQMRHFDVQLIGGMAL